MGNYPYSFKMAFSLLILAATLVACANNSLTPTLELPPTSIPLPTSTIQSTNTPTASPSPIPSPTQTPTQTLTPSPTPVGPFRILVPANQKKGFEWPYYLYVPQYVNGSHLLVVPNNSGDKFDNFKEHQNRAVNTFLSRLPIAIRLEIPLLVPVFPRFDDISDGTIASQYLGRGTLESYWQQSFPLLARQDLQLVAMIDDARDQLKELGIEIDQKVFIEGYSASALFASRFTILHPERVQAAAFGGHGWAIAPTDSWKGIYLPFPYGTGDIEKLTGKPFNLSEFKKVAIFAYMGEKDNTGWALPWYTGDWYNQAGFYSLFKRFGSSARELTDSAKEVYQAVGGSATFVIYPDQDHNSAYSHDSDILNFFQSHK